MVWLRAAINDVDTTNGGYLRSNNESGHQRSTQCQGTVMCRSAGRSAAWSWNDPTMASKRRQTRRRDVQAREWTCRGGFCCGRLAARTASASARKMRRASKWSGGEGVYRLLMAQRWVLEGAPPGAGTQTTLSSGYCTPRAILVMRASSSPLGYGSRWILASSCVQCGLRSVSQLRAERCQHNGEGSVGLCAYRPGTQQ